MTEEEITRRNELAKVIARAITGSADVDMVVIKKYPFQTVGDSFVLMPLHGEPLWMYFLPAADAVIDHYERDDACQ